MQHPLSNSRQFELSWWLACICMGLSMHVGEGKKEAKHVGMHK